MNIRRRGWNASFAQLLKRSSSSRKNDDSIRHIHNRSLFGNQIHAINNWIYKQHVIVLHRSKRLCAIISMESLNGDPLIRSITQVNIFDDLLEFDTVFFILLYVLTRRYKERQKLDLALKIWVLFEHLCIRLKASHNIFCRLDTIHAHNRFFT